MSIQLKTHKMIWGRAGNRCAFPDCRKELVMDATETDDESLIGEECHIVARKTDGPRGHSDLTSQQRDKYSNLLLMCRVHHKIIDDQPGEYTVEKLQGIKNTHEQWVRRSLKGFDREAQKDDELYASIVERWSILSDLASWEDWSSYVLGAGQPRLLKEINESLTELKDWLFSRIWPKRYPDLEAAFENFRLILGDFLKTFHKYSEKFGNDYTTKKIYNREHENRKLHNRLYREYEFHVALVEDLMMELTRAANYICDQTRNLILPLYRLQEGLVITQSGPHMDLSFKRYRLEYRDKDRCQHPYQGLDDFKIIRRNRDFHFGIGQSIDDPEFEKWFAES